MHEYKAELIKKYPRAIIHMREQNNLKRFGLVFGAGISKGFGFPAWNDLIQRIASDEQVEGEKIVKEAASKASISQLLFQNYRAKALKDLPEGFDQYDRLSSYIQSGWHRIINKALYRDVPSDIDNLREKDPYLKEYFEIIKKSKLTVNYNFDDTIQFLLSESRTDEDRRKSRGFRTIWSADIQLYPQPGVIYHPNGFLPRDFRERSSDDLIFLEDSFGDQLMESASGHYSALSYHFAQNTCFFIGLSLEDSTLKHLLRKNAILHPGHVHYYVYFMGDDAVLDEKHRIAIRDANFEVYNLVTLFLDRKRIATLGQLLTATEDEIGLLADELGVSTSYKFFLTGSVAVGKSTSVSHFRSLLTHDEWLDQKAPGMDTDPSKVEDETVIRHIDEWVVKQWRHKNFSLNQTNRGIHIIDRSPLDAFAFTPEDKWVDKAKFTKAKIMPNKSSTKLCKGKVVLLIGDPEVMAVRAMKLQKDVTPEKLGHRQQLLRVVYSKNDPGVDELDTRDKPIARVVKEICRIIHLDDYEECDLQLRLEKIENGEISPNNYMSNQVQKEGSSDA